MKEQFLRTEMVLGPEAMERLAAAHVAVFGLGGVGSWAAEALARAGIGTLTLIDHDEVGSFVWAADENDRLEIRSLTLGDYDAENDMYQITSGLTAQDRIAYPSEELVEGGPVTSDESLAAGPVQDPAFPEDGAAVDDGMLYGEEGTDGSYYAEDGTYDDTYGNTDDAYDDAYDDTEAGDAELDGGVTVEARDAGAAFDLVQDSEGAA